MISNSTIERALDALERALLELRYNPDRPRVPAGNLNGGQWASEGGSAGTGRVFSGTQRMAQVTRKQVFSGYLERQNYLSRENVYECTSFDSRQNYRFMERWDAPCPAIRLYYLGGTKCLNTGV
jgi:hypothetical protein